MLAGVYFPAGLVVGLVVVASELTGLPVSTFTRDPAQVTQSSPYVGFLSNLGILLWCASAAVCFLAFGLLRTRPGETTAAGFFLASALLSTWLLLDDLFLLHEEFLWRQLGLGERKIFAGYGLLVLLYLAYYRRVIIRDSNGLLLLLALGWFALAMVFDRVRHHQPDLNQLLEDAPKFFGLATWLAYFGRTCFQHLRLPPREPVT